MGARARMTHRAVTERDVANQSTDPFGQPTTGPAVILSDQPCYFQSTAAQFIADGSKIAYIADHLMLFPLMPTSNLKIASFPWLIVVARHWSVNASGSLRLFLARDTVRVGWRSGQRC